MHSSLRNELCGTPKIYRSARTRSTQRSLIRTRKFSNRTYLLGQPGSKDSDASCSGSQPTDSSTSKDNPPKLNAPAQGIGADLEKWIQQLSDRGHSLDVWDSISEKDESGKRKLLPHIKNELERLGQQKTQGGQTEQTVGLEIKNGQIRPLTSSELWQDKASAAKKGEIGAIILRTDSSQHDSKTKNASDSAETAQSDSLPSSQIEVGDSNTKQGPNDEDPQPQVNGSNLISKFHGSSAARRHRERQSRLRDKVQSVALPDWFQERNLLLWQDNLSNISKDPSVEELERHHDETAHSHNSTSVQSSPVVSEDAQVMKDPQDQRAEDESPIGKVQTHASGPSADEPTNEDGAPGSSGTSSEDSSPTLVALPNANKRYYIHAAQRKELTLTAKGRLRLPAAGNFANKVTGGIRSHLLVHYTAQDGDLFLDRLIEDVASQLRCNLMTLDAQDISALISKADVDTVMTEEAKTLSYEIYGDIYKEESQEEEYPSMFPEDIEEGEDENGPASPQGFPFITGRPITIDLKAIFGGRNNRRSRDPFMPRNVMQDMTGRAGIAKPTSHIFHPLIDTILSSTSNKRSFSGEEESLAVNEVVTDSKALPPDATIVHIKDLKAIQETNIGKVFLEALYEQVERRRSNGEPIMLIGTSCERGGVTNYDSERIRNMHVSEPDEISSTLVITPPYSSTSAEGDSETKIRDDIQRTVIPSQDRAKRIQLINARHLYGMLQSKDIPLDSLKEGFWTRDLTQQFDERTQECLSKSFWSFSYVQRLAAILASSKSPQSSSAIASAAGIIEESDKLKFSWAKTIQPGKTKRGKQNKESDEPEHSKLAQIRSKATKHEKKLLSGVIEPKKIPTTFKDIHIPAETVEALQTLTTLSLVRPDAFKYGVLASDRIPGLLLYGPPGTGKTLAAKAVARESGATMLEVSAADINDMYVGEGEKNVKALFSLAKKLSPCVVFLDEADAMFSARSNTGRRVNHRELLNQFLKEWDGMSNDSGSAFIMVATNRPMDLDDAVLRRLPRRLLVDLPTEKDRQEILKIHLRYENLASDVDLADLASRTQFYSGSDLKNVAVAAALNCVREENTLAKEHTGSEPYKYPSKRTLTSAHFDIALEEISASISEDMASLREIKKFDEQYGDRKGRKRKSPKWGFKTASEADAVLDTVKVRQ